MAQGSGRQGSLCAGSADVVLAVVVLDCNNVIVCNDVITFVVCVLCDDVVSFGVGVRCDDVVSFGVGELGDDVVNFGVGILCDDVLICGVGVRFWGVELALTITSQSLPPYGGMQTQV